MDQELDICKKVHEKAIYKMRVCHDPEEKIQQAFLHSKLTLHCKKYEVLKQVAYVNYNLSEFKELSPILG